MKPIKPYDQVRNCTNITFFKTIIGNHYYIIYKARNKEILCNKISENKLSETEYIHQ